MADTLDEYIPIVGQEVIDQLRQLARPLQGIKVVHINSTRVGGGVAEILTKMVPLMNTLGIQAEWEIITDGVQFFQCTKSFHNALQGNKVVIGNELLNHYEKINQDNAVVFQKKLEEADVVFIHDPQPLALIKHFPKRKGKWIWRCHIDVSHPYRSIWRYLSQYISLYDASIYSLADFAPPLPHSMYLIAPSIDPLSEKNIELPKKDLQAVCEEFHIDPVRPKILQVSRFDRFKDPLGVIEAYRLVKKFRKDVQLILAGGGASDDPEAQAVLTEVEIAKGNDPDIFVLNLPSDSHRKINALQAVSDVVLQKSIKEGFGLTVTEALWKAKPVIGGNVGGIRLQVVDHQTGFLVNTPEGAALRTRYLLQQKEKAIEMGAIGKEFVREKFLITRHLRDYLTLMIGLVYDVKDHLELHLLSRKNHA